MRSATDGVLILRVARGEEHALSKLHDRDSGRIYGVGMRYLGDRTLAEDLVQDVFISVWRNAASFDPSKASFATWVDRITRNRATDLVRSRRARVRTVAPAHETFEEYEEGDETEEILRTLEVLSLLSQISPVHREILVLAYFEGLSQREISQRTGTPLGTVKTRTTAALRSAREKMLARKALATRRRCSERSRLEEGK